MTGSECGSERSVPDAIGVFIDEEGAYTTVAAAVTMLVVLALVFSAASTVWGMARAGDVQVCADSSALSGANVVASYSTAATAVDASILSLGLAGLVMTGVGFVGLFVPGAGTFAAETINAGLRALDMRNDFAASASKGLQALERVLPVAVAARAMETASVHTAGSVSYRGVAVAVPLTSASDFAAIEGEQIPLDDLEASAAELEQVAAELAEASRRTAEAKQRAWLADCGREGRNMQERAASLTGLSNAENPDYAASASWDPAAGLARARAYYRWRLANEQPEGSGVEAQADSAARSAFYEFALSELEAASVTSSEDAFAAEVPLLPRNTDEVRMTSLYTEARWPTSIEGGATVLHYGSTCPGAAGPAGASRSLADVEAGRIAMCETCRFDVGDVGKTPAASTSIDNGFEYHLREYTQALEEYERCRNEEIALEKQAREGAVGGASAFEDTLSALSAKRPRIAPPGRYGCVGLAVSEAGEMRGTSSFAEAASVGARAAISAAVLAPQAETQDANVLSEFLSSLKLKVGEGGAVGLVDSVMDMWGALLVSYGDIADGAGEIVKNLLGGLDAFGASALSDWFGGAIADAVDALGFAPADLRLKKPVLTNTQNLFARAGLTGVVDVQQIARALPPGATDPASVLEALGYQLEERVLAAEVTIAEIPIPGTSRSIPLTVRLKDVLGGGAS